MLSTASRFHSGLTFMNKDDVGVKNSSRNVATQPAPFYSSSPPKSTVPRLEGNAWKCYQRGSI